MRPPVLGIDPGGQFAGLVLRRGDELLGHRLVRRDARPGWIRIEGWLRGVRDAGLALLLDAGQPDDVAVAVEGVNPPTGHLGMIHVGGLISTAVMAGYLYGVAWPAATYLVPPGGNGSGPLIAYPVPLRPTRGQGKGADNLRHCRSAWDVAGASLALLAA